MLTCMYNIYIIIYKYTVHIYIYGTCKYFAKLIYHHGSCSLFARIFICFNLLHTLQRGWNMNQIWTPSNGSRGRRRNIESTELRGRVSVRRWILSEVIRFSHFSIRTYPTSLGMQVRKGSSPHSAMWDLSGLKLGKPRWTAGKLLFFSHKY